MKLQRPWILLLLLLLLVACGEGETPTPIPFTPLPPTRETPTSTPTEVPSPLPPATATPQVVLTPPDDVPRVQPGTQPNTTEVIQEVQSADLDGDALAEQVITYFWQEPGEGTTPIPLQVDVVDDDERILYTLHTWSDEIDDPSTVDLEEYPLWFYDRIERADLQDLTGDGTPEVVILTRGTGTGAILGVQILDVVEDVIVLLFEGRAYKGGLDYTERGFTLTQPLYMYGEPNCCPCRFETTHYAWERGAFLIDEHTLAPVSEAGDCPPFPQPARWEMMAVEGEAPAPRRDAVLVYDFIRDRLILFGGRSTAALNDTWAFDLESRTWRELVPPEGLRPPARYGAVAGLDSSNDRLLVATGAAGPGRYLNDLWQFDLKTDSWSEVVVEGDLPPERAGAVGGIYSYGTDLYLSQGRTGDGCLADTWVYTPEENRWSNVAAETVLPPERCGASGTMVAAVDLMVFGGCAPGIDACPLARPYLLNYLAEDTYAWVPVVADDPLPQEREDAGLIYLSDRDEVLLFGGLGEGDLLLADTWIFERVQRRWRKLEPLGAPPTPRQGHSLAWADVYNPEDLHSGYVVLFGGEVAGAFTNELWLLSIGDE